MKSLALCCILAAALPAWAAAPDATPSEAPKATAAAAPKALPADTPLVVDGDIVVDARDVEANLLRIPEERRTEFRTSYERVASVVDGIFITRTLASRVRELGWDKDPLVQRRLRQLEENFLADLYVQRMEKEVKDNNLERRAKEIYAAERSKFVEPEMVNVQHILVSLNGRTREMARERAQEIARKARAGEEPFLDLAARYSDDGDKRRNGGNLGLNSPTSFNEPVQKALATMKDGQISDPIESNDGFHIMRLVERKPPKPLPYEAVRKSIIDAEVQRLQKQRRDAIVGQIRGSPTATVHRENVEALVVPVDPTLVQQALEAKPR